ncbi:MAG: hypothetical protein R3F11_03255 [Verrucomicrobiales bacterium]
MVIHTRSPTTAGVPHARPGTAVFHATFGAPSDQVSGSSAATCRSPPGPWNYQWTSAAKAVPAEQTGGGTKGGGGKKASGRNHARIMGAPRANASANRSPRHGPA